MPMGSGPGSASRASAPTTSPQSARKTMNHSVMRSAFPAARFATRTGALDDEVPLRLVLLVAEDAGLVQVDELAQQVDGLELVALDRPGRRDRCGHSERSDGVGIDSRALEPLAGVLDADATLGEPQRVGPRQRALLDEAAVEDDERDRGDEPDGVDDERTARAGAVRDRTAAERADEPD